MSDEQWGPWINHDGKGCPCVGEYVQANFTCLHTPIFEGGTKIGNLWEGVATGIDCWDWAARQQLTKFTRYRIRKPKGLTVLESILAEVETKQPKVYVDVEV